MTAVLRAQTPPVQRNGGRPRTYPALIARHPQHETVLAAIAHTATRLADDVDGVLSRPQLWAGGVEPDLTWVMAASPATSPATTQAAADTAAALAAPAPEDRGGTTSAPGHLAGSPNVGVFCRGPQPGAPACGNPGDRGRSGDRLRIVEMTKHMILIEAGRDAQAAEALVSDGARVDFDTPPLRLEVPGNRA